MPHRSRHRLSPLRLARGRDVLWPVWALAVLLVLSNAMAAATPMRISMASTIDMSATRHAIASMTVMAEPGVTTGAMLRHHHHGAMAGGEHSAAPAPHGNGCLCCSDGHCDCLQACSPLPQIAAALTVAPPLSAIVPAPLRVVSTTSFVDTPPIRPPIG